MDPGHERLVALDIRQVARLLFTQTQQLPEIRPYCSSAASLPMHAVHDEEHGHARKRHFAHSAPKLNVRTSIDPRFFSSAVA